MIDRWRLWRSKRLLEKGARLLAAATDVYVEANKHEDVGNLDEALRLYAKTRKIYAKHSRVMARTSAVLDKLESE